MSIGIVDIGIGNVGSLCYAVYNLGWDGARVSRPGDFAGLTHLLLPGVGAFSSAMHRLRECALVEPVRRFAGDGHPVMGICLGMQLLAGRGMEGGDTAGLGLIPGTVAPIQAPGLRLPHVGWNNVQHLRPHPLFEGISNDVDFYFVHSYRFIADEAETVLARTEYGESFPSVIGKGNVVGTQFHPEKSQVNGLRLLDNFCCWDGTC